MAALHAEAQYYPPALHSPAANENHTGLDAGIFVASLALTFGVGGVYSEPRVPFFYKKKTGLIGAPCFGESSDQ